MALASGISIQIGTSFLSATVSRTITGALVVGSRSIVLTFVSTVSSWAASRGPRITKIETKTNNQRMYRIGTSLNGSAGQPLGCARSAYKSSPAPDDKHMKIGLGLSTHNTQYYLDAIF